MVGNVSERGRTSSNRVSRVEISEEAERLVNILREMHGPLMFHQSGGCCDGSSPMCYPRDEFMVSHQDVFLGMIADCPVYIASDQFEYWAHTHLTIDAVEGRGGGFSLESPEGYRFLTRSRVFTEEETKILNALGPPPRGDEVDIEGVSVVEAN